MFRTHSPAGGTTSVRIAQQFAVCVFLQPAAGNRAHPSHIKKKPSVKRQQNLARTMVSRTPKRAATSSEDETSSDSASTREEEKTIPFLRRLRDMLVENKDAISFVPGYPKSGQNTLGRIVVHDRVQVESKVLPQYFNHSSFASLRRQLNYFSFVRLGKGRQRESTYVNENVVALDDILLLKRRSGGVTTSQDDAPIATNLGQSLSSSIESSTVDEDHPSPLLVQSKSDWEIKQHRPKRRRLMIKPLYTLPPERMASPEHTFVSDEDSDSKQYIALDLTEPALKADEEVLAGCSALLELASHGWD